MTDLVQALLSYKQADEDGIMVLVSRQACEEAAAEIERLHARLEISSVMRGDGKRVFIPFSDRNSIPDGIACRDETIRMLEARINELTNGQE